MPGAPRFRGNVLEPGIERSLQRLPDHVGLLGRQLHVDADHAAGRLAAPHVPALIDAPNIVFARLELRAPIGSTQALELRGRGRHANVDELLLELPIFDMN